MSSNCSSELFFHLNQPSSRTKRYLGYIRVNPNSDSSDLETQRTLMEFTARASSSAIQIYEDSALAEADPYQRPAFTLMINELKRDDIILIKNLNSFTNSSSQQQELSSILKEKGAEVIELHNPKNSLRGSFL